MEAIPFIPRYESHERTELGKCPGVGKSMPSQAWVGIAIPKYYVDIAHISGANTAHMPPIVPPPYSNRAKRAHALLKLARRMALRLLQ